MGHRVLPPEAVIDLQIHLDRVRSLEERCSKALRDVAVGTITKDVYCGLLHEQANAQKAWVERHSKYFLD